MAKRRTVAELEDMIANRDADIRALYAQQERWLEQHNQVYDEWNKGLNKIEKLKKKLKRERTANQVKLDKAVDELAAANHEVATLRARVAELWRAFSHQTNAFASK